MERKNERDSQGEMVCRKKPRISKDSVDLFGTLPDDIVMVIFGKLSSSARSPQDFINVLLTCKRLNRLALEPAVLKEAGMFTVAVRAKNWSNNAHRFIKKCVCAGSTEAAYFLGMIRFYCMEGRKFGKELLTKAAVKDHAPALYSLAIINFNGSGGSRDSKDHRFGGSLCARAADLGHIDSIRELGYCFQDGYGVKKNLKKARTLLTLAAVMDVACAIRASAKDVVEKSESQLDGIMSVKTNQSSNPGPGRAFWTQFGLELTPRETHPANRFLLEWFGRQGVKLGVNLDSDSGRVDGLCLCSDPNCGRLESRENEFRKCSVCSNARYCSRGCQAQDWKVRHRFECSPVPQLDHEILN